MRPRELPLLAATVAFAASNAPAGSVTAREASGPNQEMVLGRQLTAGANGEYGGYTGPAHVGHLLPGAFAGW